MTVEGPPKDAAWTSAKGWSAARQDRQQRADIQMSSRGKPVIDRKLAPVSFNDKDSEQAGFPGQQKPAPHEQEQGVQKAQTINELQHVQGKLSDVGPKPKQMEQVPQPGQQSQDHNEGKEAALVESPINFKTLSKLVHLDLKGAPPKVDYLIKLLPLFKSWGATGLLVEYEDMFPYTHDLRALTSGNAYTGPEVKTIIDTAAKNQLEFIPLVQTFGHMEFALKNKGFEKYREVPHLPSAINPCIEESKNLIFKMIEQLMSLHTGISWLHIGADEVYDLGVSPECIKMMQAKNWTRGDLFLHHVKTVASHIKDKYPSVQPLMWDDMFRKLFKDSPVSALKDSGIGQYVDPVVWYYRPVIELPDLMWQQYSRAFKSVWVAGAFKGASGPSQFITDIESRMNNSVSWVKVMKYASTKYKVNFKGIMLTGWQRYDHFAVLCELLPEGIPSLVVCLKSIQHAATAEDISLVRNKAMKALGFKHLQIKLDTHDFKGITCSNSFPGCAIYRLIQKFQNLKYHITRRIDHYAVGWLDGYNVEYQFSNPGRLETMRRNFTNIMKNLSNIEQSMRTEMSKIYYKDDTEEWQIVNIRPIAKKLEKIDIESRALLSHDSWPRRPLRKPPQMETNQQLPPQDANLVQKQKVEMMKQDVHMEKTTAYKMNNFGANNAINQRSRQNPLQQQISQNKRTFNVGVNANEPNNQAVVQQKPVMQKSNQGEFPVLKSDGIKQSKQDQNANLVVQNSNLAMQNSNNQSLKQKIPPVNNPQAANFNNFYNSQQKGQ